VRARVDMPLGARMAGDDVGDWVSMVATSMSGLSRWQRCLDAVDHGPSHCGSGQQRTAMAGTTLGDGWPTGPPKERTASWWQWPMVGSRGDGLGRGGGERDSRWCGSGVEPAGQWIGEMGWPSMRARA
jgi:hypothetical protein